MEAAFTVMVIFTLSTIVVRLASTIMRLTGLPDNVARFQSLSAITGTGFTTRESELIVNYPIRRRVQAGLGIGDAQQEAVRIWIRSILELEPTEPAAADLARTLGALDPADRIDAILTHLTPSEGPRA